MDKYYVKILDRIDSLTEDDYRFNVVIDTKNGIKSYELTYKQGTNYSIDNRSFTIGDLVILFSKKPDNYEVFINGTKIPFQSMQAMQLHEAIERKVTYYKENMERIKVNELLKLL